MDDIDVACWYWSLSLGQPVFVYAIDDGDTAYYNTLLRADKRFSTAGELPITDLRKLSITMDDADWPELAVREVGHLATENERLQRQQEATVALLSALMLRIGRNEASLTDIADTVNTALGVLDDDQ